MKAGLNLSLSTSRYDQRWDGCGRVVYGIKGCCSNCHSLWGTRKFHYRPLRFFPQFEQVITHQMQRYAVWFGGSMLASTPEFYQVSILDLSYICLVSNPFVQCLVCVSSCHVLNFS